MSSLLIIALYAEEMKLTIVAGLLSEDVLERGTTYNKILDQRKNTINELVSIINQPNIDKSSESNSFYYAIELLKISRAKEAVNALSNHLMYVYDYLRTDETLPSEYYYVVAVALVEIGNQSIESMLAKIQKGDSEEERNLAAWVIMQIDGKEQALNRMDIMINKGGESKERFESAKKYIENYKPTSGRPKKK